MGRDGLRSRQGSLRTRAAVISLALDSLLIQMSGYPTLLSFSFHFFMREEMVNYKKNEDSIKPLAPPLSTVGSLLSTDKITQVYKKKERQTDLADNKVKYSVERTEQERLTGLV